MKFHEAETHDLDALRSAEPGSSPVAISSWMAMQIAHRLLKAARAMPRGEGQSIIMQSARDLEQMARSADPTLIETGEVGPEERQSLYAMLGEDDRRVLRGISLDKPAPWANAPLSPIVDRLISLGLVDSHSKMALTPRGEQIAAGINSRWSEGKD